MGQTAYVAAGITSLEAYDRLFMALAEELKSPLMRIARQAELLSMQSSESAESLNTMQMHADLTVQLLDSYLLSLRLAREPEMLFALQPISIGSVLHETKERLNNVAREYNVDVELEIGGRYEPVLANGQALTSALVSLGYSVIEALPGMGPRQLKLQLAAHRIKNGIAAGMYFDVESLTPEELRRAQPLFGVARQPIVGTLSGSGAGVFLADIILRAMQSRLRVGRYQKQTGFAATLAPSSQLQLV